MVPSEDASEDTGSDTSGVGQLQTDESDGTDDSDNSDDDHDVTYADVEVIAELMADQAVAPQHCIALDDAQLLAQPERMPNAQPPIARMPRARKGKSPRAKRACQPSFDVAAIDALYASPVSDATVEREAQTICHNKLKQHAPSRCDGKYPLGAEPGEIDTCQVSIMAPVERL